MKTNAGTFSSGITALENNALSTCQKSLYLGSANIASLALIRVLKYPSAYSPQIFSSPSRSWFKYIL